MVLIHQVDEPVEQCLALFFCHTIDVLDMSAYWKDTLPTRDGIRSDNWMNSLELASNVLWRATSLVIKFKISSFRRIDKSWLSKGCRQCLQELLIWLADAIVDFVARGP